jgi:hypothetical protein
MRFLSILPLLFLVSGAQAKRTAPPIVKPVIKNGVQFSYEIEKLNLECPEPTEKACGDRIFVVAKKLGPTPKVQWKTEIYRAVFDRTTETDVQAILPKSLRVKNANVELTDEHGSHYLIARASGKLVKPKEVFVYSGP